ncbi:Beta-(1,2)-xylosyltransferase [Arachis hypogaea]|nr:Beta-(1,2)-xylosyltransferase [Arachis hypogaea]
MAFKKKLISVLHCYKSTVTRDSWGPSCISMVQIWLTIGRQFQLLPHGFRSRLKVLTLEEEPRNMQGDKREVQLTGQCNLIKGAFRQYEELIQRLANLDLDGEGRGGVGDVMGREEDEELHAFQNGAFEVDGGDGIGAVERKTLIDREFLDRYVPMGRIQRHTTRDLIRVDIKIELPVGEEPTGGTSGGAGNFTQKMRSL